MDEDKVEIQGRRIGVDDFIKVLASVGKPAFVGKVRGWWITEDGTITAIDVWGGKPGHEMMRSIRPERVVALSTRMQNKLQLARIERTSK